MQNSNLKKELLGQHNEVSAAEMDSYLKGTLSDRQAREVEMKIHSNEFSSVAAEGFSTYGAAGNVADAGAQWKSKGSNNLVWYSLSGIALITLLSVLLISSSEPELADGSNTNTEAIASIQDEEKQEKAIVSEAAKVVSTENVNQKAAAKKAHVIPQEKNEKSQELDAEAEQLLFSAQLEEEIFGIESLKPKSGSLVTSGDGDKIKTQQVSLRHYRNYKLVDQGIGMDQSLLKPLLSNTPPFSEKIIVNPEIPEWVSADSVYRITLNKAIDLMIDEKYNDSQMKLEKLVENNSSDLTATFYLGYVLYLKQDYEKAISYFNLTQSHIIQTYDHDSRFLEIKCLLNLGKEEEAKKEAKYLKNVKSFYADKAQDLVQ